MAKIAFPTILHLYKNHHMDSSRWDTFTPRKGDVIVATYPKSGSTWMQWIVLKLLSPQHSQRYLQADGFWFENRLIPQSYVANMLARKKHPPLIKTHLPLDALPYFPEMRYIAVFRDGRDVAMSLWNHYKNYTDQMYESLNKQNESAFPRCPETFQEFWNNWITRGWFDWEQDGYPFGSYLHFVESWWKFHHLPNILIVHFADLLDDLEREIQRVADHIDVSLSLARRAEITNQVTFDAMKKDAEKHTPIPGWAFKEGAASFFYKGTNGRWKHMLTEQEIAQYEAVLSRVLPPDCTTWLKRT
uniref:Aryl sulfotransferase n=1 Tax=Candidatus Kentrum sp. FM TaxID=2126340 RepID=A0A450S615_9GAMM|nr:MAG: aryl sulfotransferase [Candidatus Kentron sp. FM]VFJ47340.1 MAG: aryl sulfotransferase [Candidatus Kentron sp. FM]VFK07558.1 MAG: aryl sulfotransferase [Candidatus Kentron sp. FM]